MIAWISRVLLAAAAVIAGCFVSQNMPGIETFDTTLAILLVAFTAFGLAFWPTPRNHGH